MSSSFSALACTTPTTNITAKLLVGGYDLCPQLSYDCKEIGLVQSTLASNNNNLVSWVSRPQVVAWWLNSPVGRVGLRFESWLCFSLPTTSRHQEIQGVGYADHKCGRRPWVPTPLTVLVCLSLLTNYDLILNLLGLQVPSKLL